VALKKGVKRGGKELAEKDILGCVEVYCTPKSITSSQSDFLDQVCQSELEYNNDDSDDDDPRADVSRPYLTMANLVVKESARGLGLGRALLQKVEEIARDEWEVREMVLIVDGSNSAAISLYTSMGYVEVGRKMDKEMRGDASFGKKVDVELVYMSHLL